MKNVATPYVHFKEKGYFENDKKARKLFRQCIFTQRKIYGLVSAYFSVCLYVRACVSRSGHYITRSADEQTFQCEEGGKVGQHIE